MATPNITSPTTIKGYTATVIPANTSVTQLGPNAASGHVFSVNSIVAANVTGSAATVTVAVYSAVTLGGTATRLCYQVSVPANTSLIVVDKSTGLWIDDAQSIGVTSGTSSAIEYTMTYEDLV